MSSTVKSIKVTYNPVNDRNTFTCGDCVSGTVVLEVAKECEMDSLEIKFKGKAEVLWTERHGKTTVVYHSKDKYFSIKQYYVHDKELTEDFQTLLRNEKGEPYSKVVAPGCHVYPFSFLIPHQDMSSSFESTVGNITYALEAKLSRSMRFSSKDKAKLRFVTTTDLSSDPELMNPQHDSKDKKLTFFNSGTVAMDVNLEKTGFFQGEGLKVLAFIENNSSREIKPKYCVYSKHSFFARGKRRLHTSDLFKEVGEPIPPSAKENVMKILPIPVDLQPTILNCSNIKVEYRLRVYLDVKYASDPKIKFPIVILPASQVPAVVAPPPAASGFGFEPFGSTNPPAWGIVPPQQPPPTAAAAPQPFEPPPPYGAHAMYPTLTDFSSKY